MGTVFLLAYEVNQRSLDWRTSTAEPLIRRLSDLAFRQAGSECHVLIVGFKSRFDRAYLAPSSTIFSHDTYLAI